MADVLIRYVGEDDTADASKSAADGIKGIEDAASSAGGGVSGLFKDAFSFVTGGLITSAISTVTGSIGGLISGMAEGHAEFQTYQNQFTALLGNADDAKAHLADLSKFAQSAPFDMAQVTAADKVLYSFGLHTADSAAMFGKSGEEILRIAGNVAAGTGNSFESVTTLVGQLAAGQTDKVIKELSKMGIASKAELANMGLQFDESGKLLSPLPEAVSVVTDLMNKKFSGQMDKQNHTFAGMKANFEEFFNDTLRIASAPIFDKLQEGLGKLMSVMESPAIQEGIASIANGIGNVLGGAISSVMPFIDTFVKIIENVSRVIGHGGGLADILEMVLGTAIYKTFGIFEDEGFAVADGIVASFQPVIDIFNAVASELGEAGVAFDAFKEWVGGGKMSVEEFADVLPEFSSAFLSEFIPPLLKAGVQFAGIFEDVKNTVINILGAVVAVVQAELKVIVKFWADHGTEIMAKVKEIWDTIVEIIHLALALINATIVPLLKAIAKFISEHGTEIGNVFKGAWDVISGIIDTAITLIKGILKIGLALLKGDTQGALDGLVDMFTHIWDNIKGIVQGAWDFISNIVKLVGEAIAKITGQQSQASSISVSYNSGYSQGKSQGGGSSSVSMAGDTYYVGSSNVAAQIQHARKTATQQALLRATVGT